MTEQLSQTSLIDPDAQAPLLTPRSPIQILTAAMGLYRVAWLEFIAVAGAGYMILLLLAVLYGLAYQPVADNTDEVLLTMYRTFGIVGGSLLLLIVHIIVTAVLTLTISRKYLSRPFSIVAGYRAVLQRWDSLFAAVGLLLVLIASILLVAGIPIAGWIIAPGLLLFWFGALSLVPVIVMIEGMPGTWAVARVWGLTRQHLYRTFGGMLVLGLIGLLLLALPSGIMWLVGLPFQPTDIWLPLLLGVFYAPYYATGTILIYYDLRVRSESFSTELLADNMANGVVPPNPFTLSAIYAPAEHQKGLLSVHELGKFVVMSLIVGLLLAGAGAGIVGLMVTVPSAMENIAADETIGTSAPNFTLNTPDGQPVTMINLQGKPVVLNFWATWCPPCEEELPALEAAFDRYQGEVNFLAVSVEESAGVVRPFVDERGLTLPVLLDTDGEVVNLYDVKALPTTIFIDANGVIAERYMGALDLPTINSYLQALVEQ
jgi:cytochrome c biogenesis protein CcmG/thiol:disulfide interchange protein DsbE